MRLTRQQSLNRAYQFARVRREGVSVAGRFIVLNACPQDDLEAYSAFGIICTKKVGGAVMRNTLKRRIRSLIRERGEVLERGLHVVCILRQRAAGAEYVMLEKDWQKTVKRLLRELKGQRNNQQEEKV